MRIPYQSILWKQLAVELLNQVVYEIQIETYLLK